MKKLGRVTINSEKVISNKELVSLRGGYGDTGCCECFDMENIVLGYVAASTKDDCDTDCEASYPGTWSSEWNC